MHATREARAVRLGVAGAVLLVLVLGALSAYTVPLFNPPDEASHYGYAAEVASGNLPHIETLIPAEGVPLLEAVIQQRDVSRRTIWTANHPPLHYVLQALPIGIGRSTGHELGAVHAGRLLSVGVASLTVVAVAWLARLLFPRRPSLVVAAAGFAALAPAMVHTSASLYNDSLAVLTSTLAFGAGVAWLRRGPSRNGLLLLAVTCSLAAATRASGLVVVGVVGLAVLYGSLIHRPTTIDHEGESAGRTVRRLLGPAAVVGAAVVATSGWFYLRNIRLYGDFTATSYLLERFARTPRRSPLEYLTSHGFWTAQQRRLWDVSTSTENVGSLGRLLWWLVFVPLIGMAVGAARSVRRLVRRTGSAAAALADVRFRLNNGPLTRFAEPAAWVLGFVLILMLELSVAQFVSQGGGTHVRYVLPALGVAAAVGAYGMFGFPRSRHGVPAIAFLLAMTGANLLGLRGRLQVVLPDVDGQVAFLHGLQLAGVPAAGLWLAVVAVLVLVGLVAQAVALWQLGEPDPVDDPAGAAAPG